MVHLGVALEGCVVIAHVVIVIHPTLGLEAVQDGVRFWFVQDVLRRGLDLLGLEVVRDFFVRVDFEGDLFDEFFDLVEVGFVEDLCLGFFSDLSVHDELLKSATWVFG